MVLVVNAHELGARVACVALAVATAGEGLEVAAAITGLARHAVVGFRGRSGQRDGGQSGDEQNECADHVDECWLCGCVGVGRIESNQCYK